MTLPPQSSAQPLERLAKVDIENASVYCAALAATWVNGPLLATEPLAAERTTADREEGRATLVVVGAAYLRAARHTSSRQQPVSACTPRTARARKPVQARGRS